MGREKLKERKEYERDKTYTCMKFSNNKQKMGAGVKM